MNALMIVGSPKIGVSTSETIGNYVLDRLGSAGHSVLCLNASVTTKTEEGVEQLKIHANKADLILFSFPLYVDSLPAPLTEACELLSTSINGSGKKVAAIANSGFPEPEQCMVSLDVLESFSRLSGLDWVGGVAVGSGAALASRKPRKLEDFGGMAFKLQKTLDLLVSAILENRHFNSDLQVKAQPLPAWIYNIMGDMGWKEAAKRRGLKKSDLLARPMLESKP
jgi:hypothetical protein